MFRTIAIAIALAVPAAPALALPQSVQATINSVQQSNAEKQALRNLRAQHRANAARRALARQQAEERQVFDETPVPFMDYDDWQERSGNSSSSNVSAGVQRHNQGCVCSNPKAN